MDLPPSNQHLTSPGVVAIKIDQPFSSLPLSTPLPRKALDEMSHTCHPADIATYGRCPYCSWSFRMANPNVNTHFNPRPESERGRYPEPGLNPPPGWPKELIWKPPYGMVARKTQPEGFQKFDPRSMLWYSQWEIIFGRTEMNLSDWDICTLYRFRWIEKEPSVLFMQAHHVPEIINLLTDNHAWHGHAFWFQGKERAFKARGEWFLAKAEEKRTRDEEMAARLYKWEGNEMGKTEQWDAHLKMLIQRSKDLEKRAKLLSEKMARLERERADLAQVNTVRRAHIMVSLGAARAMGY